MIGEYLIGCSPLGYSLQDTPGADTWVLLCKNNNDWLDHELPQGSCDQTVANYLIGQTLLATQEDAVCDVGNWVASNKNKNDWLMVAKSEDNWTGESKTESSWEYISKQDTGNRECGNSRSCL